MEAPQPDSRDLPALIGERARNLFLSRQMHCSEAVLAALNQALGGGLKENQALAIASPFAEGIGGKSCLCGALAGALLGVGLFLAQSNPIGRRKSVQAASGQLLNRFKVRFGASCCRILSKKGPADSDPLFDRCAQQTAEAAAMAAALILEHHPELGHCANFTFLDARDSVIGGLVKTALRRTGCRF